LNFTTTTSQTLSATVVPDNASRRVTWSSSDVNVATVSSGVVTPVGNGTATITVKTTNGNFTATCDVNVAFAVTGISLSPSSLSFTTANPQTITPTISPANAANQTLDWTSSNENVVTVLNGVVTPVADGTATITATATDGSGKSATCPVNVVLPYPIQGGAYSSAGVTDYTFGNNPNVTMSELTDIYGFAISGDLLVYGKDLPNATWENARAACEDLGDGWRLPNIAEIGNVWARRALYMTYWSSTPRNDTQAWFWVINNEASCATYNIKETTNNVRCVKSLDN
jgi:hypothetical protein